MKLYADEKIESKYYDLKKFKIANDPSKIMMIFSHNFYKRPTQAAFREVFANAIDEHVKYNIKRPVTVFIGQQDNPFPEFDYYVSIRDYAKGLSRGDIDRIYTTFFFSTKDKSNTQWGAFGLGSKSPFAVHTEFIVRSYHNGTMTEYLMLRSDSDLRYIVLREETTNESGLEVIFPIADNDFSFISNVLIPLNPEIQFEFKTDSKSISRSYLNQLMKVFYYDQSKKLLITTTASKNSRVKIYYSFQIRDSYYDPRAIYYPEIGSLKLTPNRDEIVDDDNYKQLKQYISQVYESLFDDMDLLNDLASYINIDSKHFYIFVVDPKEVNVAKLKDVLRKSRTVLTGIVLTEAEFIILKDQIKKYLQIDPDKVLPKIMTTDEVKKRFRSVALNYVSTKKRPIKKRTIVYHKDGKKYRTIVEADKVFEGIIDLYKNGVREFAVNTAFKSAIYVHGEKYTTITIDYLLSKDDVTRPTIIESVVTDIDSGYTKEKPRVLLAPADEYEDLKPKTIYEKFLVLGAVKVLDDFVQVKTPFPLIIDYSVYRSYDILMYVHKDTSVDFLKLSVFDKIKYCKEKGYNVKLKVKYSDKDETDYDMLKELVQQTLDIINTIEEIQNENRGP